MPRNLDCFNCGLEATRLFAGITPDHSTPMCDACAEAFELGQACQFAYEVEVEEKEE